MTDSAAKPHQASLDRLRQQFRAYGDTALGNDWHNQAACEARYRAMWDLAAGGPVRTILDLGCGSGRFLDWVIDNARPGQQLAGTVYTGVDVNEEALDVLHAKSQGRPVRVLTVNSDIVRNKLPGPAAELAGLKAEFVFACGVITNCHGMSEDYASDYAEAVIETGWLMCLKGFAFNVMDRTVGHDDRDLFSMSYDELAYLFRAIGCSRYAFRADYKPGEFTAYLYR